MAKLANSELLNYMLTLLVLRYHVSRPIGRADTAKANRKFFGAGLNWSQNVARIDRNLCIWGSCYSTSRYSMSLES